MSSLRARPQRLTDQRPRPTLRESTINCGPFQDRRCPTHGNDRRKRRRRVVYRCVRLAYHVINHS
jgi:hypothetical protein